MIFSSFVFLLFFLPSILILYYVVFRKKVKQQNFFTFRALSYTVDVYRNEIHAEKNLARYALFVSFFPALIAGPLERAKDLLPQIYEKHDFDYDTTKNGLLLMVWGC